MADAEFQVSKKGLSRTASLREEVGDKIRDPTIFVSAAKRSRVPADLLTFTEHVSDATPRFDYHMEWDNLAVLRVRTYEYWIEQQVRRSVPRTVRKAQNAGIDVSVRPYSRDVARKLLEIFNETPVRRGRRYPYFGMGIEEIEAGWSPDAEQSVFLIAECDGEAVGFIKLLLTGTVASISGSVTKLAFRQSAPMNALIAKSVEVSAERSIQYLVYGRFEYAGQSDSGLTEFKEHNGFERVDIPRYYVPLSLRGRIILSMGLHHSLSTYLPRALALQLKRLREWTLMKALSR